MVYNLLIKFNRFILLQRYEIKPSGKPLFKINKFFDGITSIANDKVLNCIYNRSIEGKKVVIGGAGTFGQQMYRRLVTR